MLPSIESILLVIVSGLILSAVPGPSMLYVMSRSIGQNEKAGLASSAGLAIGGMIHAAAAALGLSSIIALSPSLFIAIQIFGVIYLAYLGVSMLRGNIEDDNMRTSKVNSLNYFKILKQGVLVEVANPKTILFFIAFIPSVVPSTENYSSTQLLLLGLLIPLTALPSDLFIAFAGGKIADKLKRNVGLVNRISKMSGIILLLLAVKLACS